MGCIAKKKGVIDSMLIDGLKNLRSMEQLNRYKIEYKSEIIKLLKGCYPDTLLDKIVFYDESFRSSIGHYDSDLLLINLFLEKDSVSISNHLLKNGHLEMIISSYLNKFSAEYWTFLSNTFEQNSSLTEDDESKFLRESFQTIIEEISETDWVSNENNNLLVRKFIKWIDMNLEDAQVTTAFLIFTKIWNSNPNFEKSFIPKSIILYTELIQALVIRRNNSEVEGYIKFIDILNGFKSLFFNDLNYYPIIDDKESNRYSNGYFIKKSEYLDIYDQITMINQINSDLSYYELLKQIKDDSPEYLITKIEKVISSKVSLFNYPTKEEVLKIWELESGKFIDKLRNQLIKNFYLYELQKLC